MTNSTLKYHWSLFFHGFLKKSPSMKSLVYLVSLDKHLIFSRVPGPSPQMSVTVTVNGALINTVDSKADLQKNYHYRGVLGDDQLH